jgi:hypothetical protein
MMSLNLNALHNFFREDWYYMKILKFWIKQICKIIFMHTDVELKYILIIFFFCGDDLYVAASVLFL